MKIIPIETIKEVLSHSLSSNRFAHCLAVAKLAQRLAKEHDEDSDTAYRVGLVHDCVKEWSPQKMFSYAREYNLSIPHIQFIKKHAPNMMHAYVGAEFCRRQGWVKNKEALRAIRSHTLGAMRMGNLEKILFIADFCSTDRKYRSAKTLRRTAYKDLELGFQIVLETKVRYHLERKRPIHPLAIKVWKHFTKQKNIKNGAV